MAPGDVTAQSFSSRKVCLARAREHIANHAYAAAEQTLTRGREQWPDLSFDSEWLTVLGHAAWRRNRKREAVGLLRRAAREEDAHVEARFLLGRVLADCGMFDRGVEVLRKVADDAEGLVPYRAHALSALCVAYAAMGLNKSSQEAIEKAAAFGLVSAQLLADEGYRLLRIGAFKEAEVQLAKALQIDATCEDAFERLAGALYVQGKLDSAMEVLAYAIEQSAEHLPLHQLMGEVHVSRNKHREASAFFKHAVEISPDGDNVDELLYLQGRALHRAGFSEQALACFRQMLERRPRSSLVPEVQARVNALGAARKGARTRRLENFPRVLQKRSYCAPNTLANVLRYIGQPATQEDVAARILRSGSTRWPDLMDFVSEQKGIAWRLVKGSIDLIREMIDKGVPVVTTEYHGLSGHMLAVIGYDDAGELIIAQDPNYIEPVEISYTAFRKSWLHDDALCLLIVPQGKSSLLPPPLEPAKDAARGILDLLRTHNAGNLSQATELAQRLHELDKTLLTPLRVLAEISLEAKAEAELRGYCEAALKVSPDCFWARRHLAAATLLANKLEAALQQFRQALALYRDDHLLMITVAELFIALNQKRPGRAMLARILEEDPQYRRARLRLAQELAEVDKPAAVWHARVLVELDSADTQARELLAQLAGETAVREIASDAKKDAPAARTQAAPEGAPTSSEEEFEVEEDE
ncbi:hypothetical protein EDM80_03325 [bacterium]|nr:MAG: hypothetical protein EDM80_03325 [bacterium]RIK63400.1 MAG: hypothetical protein DCC64_07530 [Planctomycetota bacterium]